jgi:hypothetical protein
MADEKLLREVEEAKRKETCGGKATRPDKARGGTPNRSQYPTFTDTWRKRDQDDARVRSPGCSEAFSNQNCYELVTVAIVYGSSRINHK